MRKQELTHHHIRYERTGVVVTVTDEDGQLAAVAEYEGNQVFENSYQPKAGSIVLSAEKVLTGRTLQANEFDFELVNEAGTVLQTKANEATGRSTLTLFLTIKQWIPLYHPWESRNWRHHHLRYERTSGSRDRHRWKTDSWPQWRNMKVTKSLKTAINQRPAVSY